MKSISDSIISLRSEYNFSQTDVARQIGVTPALISAYENQDRNPSLEKLIALADIFHVSTDHLLGRTNKPDHRILIDLDGLSDNQLKIIYDLITEFKATNAAAKKP